MKMCTENRKEKLGKRGDNTSLLTIIEHHTAQTYMTSLLPESSPLKESASTTQQSTTAPVSTSKVSTIYPTDIAGKLDYADGLREQGKVFYQEKKYKKAARIYAQIPAWVSPFCKNSSGEPNQAEAMSGMMGGDAGPQASPEQGARAKELLRISYQNRAMCFVKLKKPDKALPACESALTFDDGTSWKIYRAKAESYILKKDMDKAKRALDEVLRIQGGTDKRTTQLLKHLDKMYAAHEKRERKIYANMFAQ